MDISFAHRVEMEAQPFIYFFFLSDTAGDTDIILTPNKDPVKSRSICKYNIKYRNKVNKINMGNILSQDI